MVPLDPNKYLSLFCLLVCQILLLVRRILICKTGDRRCNPSAIKQIKRPIFKNPWLLLLQARVSKKFVECEIIGV